MIGNDVVDILQARLDSNWRRPGLLQKIFTDDEQQCIIGSDDPEILIWLLWSMKEAAYKIHNRQTGIRCYAPKNLECKILDKDDTYYTGQVICLCNLYYTTTIITGDCLHTVAVTCLANLNNVIEIKKNLILKNEHGIPYLYDNSNNKRNDVSVSNHGRFEKIVTLHLL